MRDLDKPPLTHWRNESDGEKIEARREKDKETKKKEQARAREKKGTGHREIN